MLPTILLTTWLLSTGHTGTFQPTTDTVRINRAVLARALANPQACRTAGGASDWPAPIVTEEMALPGQYLFLSDGRFVFVDRSAKAIRVISPKGQELARLGRLGEGPGEFQVAAYLFRWAGDTIAVRDLSTARISLFTNAGFVRALSHGAVPSLGTAGLMGRLGDGKLVFGANHHLTEGIPDKGFHRPTIDLVGWKPGAGAVDVLRAKFPGPELRIITRNKERGALRINFPRRTAFGVTDRHILVHDDAKPEIEVLSPAGQTVRVLAFDVKDPPVSQEDRDTVDARHAFTAKRGLSSPAAMEMLKYYPPTRPGIAWHGVDADNGFWLGFHPPVASGSKVYIRLDEAGAPTHCFRPGGTEDFGIAFLGDRVVTRRQESEGDILAIAKALPYPAR